MKYKSKRIISGSSFKKLKTINKIENKIIHGETLDTLKKIPNQSIDLIVTSPAYFLGKKYEIEQSFEEYLKNHFKILEECKRVLKNDGAIFWNVAQSIIDKEIIHLGSHFYSMFKELDFFLKNWIIWKFEGGETPRNRLFGRYENILWMVKDKDNFKFNIDSIRVPTKWLKDKRVRKDGKNPEDFWELDIRTNEEKLIKIQDQFEKFLKLIKQKDEGYVNQILMDEISRYIEGELDYILNSQDQIVNQNLENNIWFINRVVNNSKTQKIRHPITQAPHPCPFPEELITRIIKMASNEGDSVLDIFSGSGTVFKVADILNRKWIGIDKEIEYCEIADFRFSNYKDGLI